MTFRSALLASVGVLTVLLAAPAASWADTVLFTNFGAGFAYDTSVANPVGNAFDGNLYGEADSFDPSVTAKLSSIDIALSCFGAGLCPDDFTVSIDKSSGDAPSTVLESFTVSAASLGLLGLNNPDLVLTSILTPTLTAGTKYWVTVTSDANDSIGWNFNSTGAAGETGLSTDGGSTWFTPSSETPGALQVNGTRGVSPVPEPSTFGLMFTGLLSLALGSKFGVRQRRTIEAAC